MRKWTYLVAALLMSGTAATFTSCIDTTEPAGIERRGADCANPGVFGGTGRENYNAPGHGKGV